MPGLEDTAEELIQLFQSLGSLNSPNVVAASGAAQSIPDPTVSAVNAITLTAACTVTLPAPAQGKKLVVYLIQDATGSRVVTWATAAGAIKWVGAAAPTLTTTAAHADKVTFECIDGTNWVGQAALNIA